MLMKKLRARLKNQKGFTLIELLVVISILGILAAIAIPRFTDATARANTAKIAADLSNIDNAIGINQAVNGADPASIQALVTNGYLVAAPTVPTGRVFIATVTTGSDGVVTLTPATTSTAISGTYGMTGTPLRATFNALTSEHYK